MHLLNLFDNTLIRRKSEVALELASAAYTFGQLDSRSNRLAQLFRARGVKPGDRLCVYLPNSLAMILVYLACAKSGVIFVPINILYREREIAHILSDAEPFAAIAAEAHFPRTGTPVWHPDELLAEAAGHADERPRADLDGDSPAAIVYTSGTTGRSKGAVLTHNNFLANACNLIACWEITAADRMLLGLPLFHVHALGNALHTWLIAGYRLRLLERFEHQKAPQEFLGFRPTLFFGVPTVYVRLLDIPLETAQAMGASARLFVCGSAPLPAQVLEDFEAKFGHRILERYGMTETLMNLSNPYSGERRGGTVGMPLPGLSARIVDGEVYIKGPNVFAGYWRRDDATAAAFVDGWFKTGDMGERSDDGYYTLKGRKSDLIISGGYNIYPREIEEVLLEDPCVGEVAVVGVPDRLRGELPAAYIVAKAPLDAGRLEQLCRDKLASFKVPRAYVQVESLPRTTLGKVQKHLLPPVPEKRS